MLGLAAGACSSEQAPPSDAATPTGAGLPALPRTRAPSGRDAGAGTAGACGPIGPWGPWPPPDSPSRRLPKLEPRFERPDCGPGCRLVTTRWNAANGRAYEMRFSGRWLTHMPPGLGTAVVVDLDALDEYEVPTVEPEPNVKSYTAALSGDCLVQGFSYYYGGAQREYVCETCLYRHAVRGLWFGAGTAEALNTIGVVTADESFVLFGGGRHEDGSALGLWALDLRDGSKHTFAPSGWLVVNVSLAAPYIALSHGDGEVHLIDTRDWSDTNVSNHPTLQWDAASDDKTVVWIDQRYHPGGGLENPANQEVVAYDIESRQLRRLTYTEETRPSAKWRPAVEGDWVVWVDDRDSNAPNTMPDVYHDRVDIYGYNLRTNREYHVLGNQAGTLPEEAHSPAGLLPSSPRLYRGKLYVEGLLQVNASTDLEIWEFELPEP